MDGPFLADTFARCADAEAIATYLMQRDPAAAFTFAMQARIGYLLQQPALFMHGQACDAYIAAARVQGSHRLWFQFLVAEVCDPVALYPADFIIYIDAAAWSRREWNPEKGPSGFPIEREHLIFHELCHLRQLETAEGEPRFGEDGRPILGLVNHTYEFFKAEIRRYGPKTAGLEQVGPDYVEGAKAEAARSTPKLRRIK